MAFVRALLHDPAIPTSQRREAIHRNSADPGVPHHRTTCSFWMRSPTQLRVTTHLPREADVVIIGSGISGASVAQGLLQHGWSCKAIGGCQKPRVVMVDARTICSGATGRNGGHCLETAEEYAGMKREIGKEAAMKVMRFRLSHLDALMNEASRLGLDEYAQTRRVKFLSVYVNAKSWTEAKKDFETFKHDMPGEAESFEAIEGVFAKKGQGLKQAVGVISGPAGALWPYKFVTGLISRLLSDYGDSFQVSENNPVIEISRATNNGLFSVKTKAGSVLTKHVIHCTNAHAGHLVPRLRGYVFPVRGQMSAQTPKSDLKDESSKHSWLIVYDRGFDYITQLPVGNDSDGEMMVGGGFAQCQFRGVEEMGIATDDELSESASAHLGHVLLAQFGQDVSKIQMWTGNMGFSIDGFPWVGKLPGFMTERARDDKFASGSTELLSAEWICAGFSGEGMVNAWLAGKALAASVISSYGQKLTTELKQYMNNLPDEMGLTQERLNRAKPPCQEAMEGTADKTEDGMTG